MTSRTKLAHEVLAEAIHRTMCYEGDKRPVCKYDLVDGRTMTEVLDKMNIRLVTKDG